MLLLTCNRKACVRSPFSTCMALPSTGTHGHFEIARTWKLGGRATSTEIVLVWPTVRLPNVALGLCNGPISGKGEG